MRWTVSNCFALQMKLRDGIRLAMAVSAEGNKFITITCTPASNYLLADLTM
jgi:hypothetical protein